MRRATPGLRVLVLGYLVRGPLGGIAWHYLQYVAGLSRLGHDVFFVEDSDDYPSCYDPVRNVTDADPTYGLAFAARSFECLGLEQRWAYYDAHQDRWFGPAGQSAHALCETADVVLNVSGVNPIRRWTANVPTRVLVDTDPGFTQIRHLTEPTARARANQHTAFLSFGENIGRPGCAVPDDGFPWLPTRQPVVMDAWRLSCGSRHHPLTTVMQWDSYRTLRYAGREFGMKSASFESLLDLPQRARCRFALAIGSATAPRDRLAQHGWRIDDPLQVTRDPWTYQDYIVASRGEFTVAKAGYVDTRSGWFSERTAAYLASGRPVVVQDTGFTDWLTAAKGILPFTDADSALAAIVELERDYRGHCQAARQCVAEWFDANKVLGRLLAGCSS